MKKRTKKLGLAKDTVRSLTSTELGEVAGGTVGPTCGCTNSNYIDCPIGVDP